jgi:hypothetical protein
MRTAVFIVLLLIPSVLARGDVVFTAGGPALSESISSIEHIRQDIQEAPYEGQERELMAELIRSILLSPECAVKRTDDLFHSMAVKTSV